jgi:hypothetical protein
MYYLYSQLQIDDVINCAGTEEDETIRNSLENDFFNFLFLCEDAMALGPPLSTFE